MRNRYFVISVAALMICAVAGLSAIKGTTEVNNVVFEHKVLFPETNIIPVEYIEFEPYYITAKVGKNEG